MPALYVIFCDPDFQVQVISSYASELVSSDDIWNQVEFTAPLLETAFILHISLFANPVDPPAGSFFSLIDQVVEDKTGVSTASSTGLPARVTTRSELYPLPAFVIVIPFIVLKAPKEDTVPAAPEPPPPVNVKAPVVYPLPPSTIVIPVTVPLVGTVISE